ncbi:MAG: tetratricopeptide repeat protein [Planctomycetes bacterium]|nr:tetratricopeptide repeat protein [Planctomycetota bacterium]
MRNAECGVRSGIRNPFALCLLPFAFCLAVSWAMAGEGPPKAKGDPAEDAKTEYRAADMLKRGIELLELKQEERGLKLISSVPRMFPNAKARFKAYLVLGQHHVEKRNYELAIKQFRYLADSEDADQQAEALYQEGICHYNLNNFDKAFMALRRVTNEFPWSVYANEAFYYIGQCHFKLGRWSKAVEALEKVGTSVPTNTQGETLAEAGQRLFVKIFDRDLVVLITLGGKPKATLTTARGDKEEVALEPLGQSGEFYIGSVPTLPGEPKPGDKLLQIVGGDTVSVETVDANTESGKRNEKRLATIKMVSTASVGFTDGAYREYTQGIFGDGEAFIRVKDLDRDTTAKKDEIAVKVFTQYKQERAPEAERTSLDFAREEETVVRDTVQVKLVETEPHSGIFVGTVVPRVAVDKAEVNQGDAKLSAMKGDELVVEYLDEAHIGGTDTREVRATAKLLIGQIQDVKIEHREVDTLDLKARKNLIEAKIYLKLGSIFKEVGLQKQATEKAAEGLDRVDDVIRTSTKASLDRSLVEEAFSVKWDLLLVQDRMGEAIAVCRTLTQLFPDSTLVDRALLKIGQARMETDKPHEAIGIFNAVISLPKSDLKAEAQYSIGKVLERVANEHAKQQQRDPDLSQAMTAYKKCAESYPDSPFAGDALEQIANYYILAKDYNRAIELMERVFQDYPDASFLDRMLLKWVIAAYRVGNLAVAKAKAEQLLAEYPNSPLAPKARQFQEIIEKKMSGGGETPEPKAEPKGEEKKEE